MYGAFCEVVCHSGYDITGFSLVYCDENGEWNNIPECEGTFVSGVGDMLIKYSRSLCPSVWMTLCCLLSKPNSLDKIITKPNQYIGGNEP